MREDRKQRFKRHFKKYKISNEEAEKEEVISQEDLEKHPELSVEVAKEKKTRPEKIVRRIPKEMIERFNKQSYTHLIMALAIILGIANITFGILGILAIFGYREDIVWKIFQGSEILGWNQLKITGFILVIIGVVMFWSVPFYLINKNQQADSYLVIASGIALLFGFIYLLIIIADILNAVVLAITDQTSVSIETAFYLPIILAIVAFPLFRLLVVRHMVVLPDIGKDASKNRWSKFYQERQHWKGHHGWKKHRAHWRSSFRRKWREEKKDEKRRDL